MLRFFLRLLLLCAVGFALGLWLVPLLLQGRFDERNDVYYQEAVRGQVYMLEERLAGLDGPARQAELARLQPHFGLGLALLEQAAVVPAPTDARQLQRFGFLSRDEQERFLLPLPAHGQTPAQWLQVSLPEGTMIDAWTWTQAALVLLLAVGVSLLLWVWPTWRDLQRLRVVSRRMGEGDLQARAQISARSSVASLARQFNQMGEHIAALVARQRELTNDVSHELRTPIARLSFELDLLDAEADPGARRQLVQDMREDLRGLDGLVGELLLEARLEHAGRALPQERVDAAAWLDEQLQGLLRDAQPAGIQCHLAGDAPVQVQLHPHYMARAVSNLLRNALAHARSVVQLQLQQCGAHWELRVCDDGPGIAAADRERVFAPFTRLDQSRQRGTGGVGLGLSMVARIAACHGGQAVVEDSPLGGASFIIRWPQLH